jgi:hypothetical protein
VLQHQGIAGTQGRTAERRGLLLAARGLAEGCGGYAPAQWPTPPPLPLQLGAKPWDRAVSRTFRPLH